MSGKDRNAQRKNRWGFLAFCPFSPFSVQRSAFSVQRSLFSAFRRLAIYSRFGVKRSAFSVQRSPASHPPPSTRSPTRSRGAGLILTVLFVAAVGILFGLGRLAMYRDQCIRRFERQREIERMLATRSVMRWLSVQITQPPDSAKDFRYLDGCGRTCDLTLRPMPSIYPAPNADHLRIGSAELGHAVFDCTDSSMTPTFTPDANYQNVLKIGSSGTNSLGHFGRVFMDIEDQGCWLDDVYGRRYWVEIIDVNKSGTPDGVGDVMRLYITPRETASSSTSGPAIWVEQVPQGKVFATTRLWIREPGGVATPVVTQQIESEYGKGVQLAGNKVTLFNWLQGGQGLGTYDFNEHTITLSDALVESFTGKDIRLTLEVESRSELASDNTFRWLRVDPAYEYDILMQWPTSHGMLTNEVATVISVLPGIRNVRDNKTYTYDSHGTQWRPGGR